MLLILLIILYKEIDLKFSRNDINWKSYKL